MGDVLGSVVKATGKVDPFAGKANEFAKDTGLDFGLLSGAERDKEFKAEHAKKQGAFDKKREQQKQEVVRTTPKAKTQSLLTRTI